MAINQDLRGKEKTDHMLENFLADDYRRLMNIYINLSHIKNLNDNPL